MSKAIDGAGWRKCIVQEMDEVWSRFESEYMEGLEKFLEEAPRDRPMRIILDSGEWGVEDCRLISKQKVGGCLRFLCLRGTNIGDEGIVALLEGEALSSLRSTCIERVGITDMGILHLAQSTQLGSLEELCVGNRQGIPTGPLNQIGDSGAFVLANLPNLTSLTSIDLSFTDVTDLGFEALFTSKNLPKLKTVYAWGSKLTRSGFESINAILSSAPLRGSIHTDFDEVSRDYF